MNEFVTISAQNYDMWLTTILILLPSCIVNIKCFYTYHYKVSEVDYIFWWNPINKESAICIKDKKCVDTTGYITLSTLIGRTKYEIDDG